MYSIQLKENSDKNSNEDKLEIIFFKEFFSNKAFSSVLIFNTNFSIFFIDTIPSENCSITSSGIIRSCISNCVNDSYFDIVLISSSANF